MDYAEMIREYLRRQAAGLEAGTSLATGMAAQVPAGLAGIGRYGIEVLRGQGNQEALKRAAESTRASQEALTYQPRTARGQGYMQNIGEGVQAVEHKLGETTAGRAWDAATVAAPGAAAVLAGIAGVAGPGKAKPRQLELPGIPPRSRTEVVLDAQERLRRAKEGREQFDVDPPAGYSMGGTEFRLRAPENLRLDPHYVVEGPYQGEHAYLNPGDPVPTQGFMARPGLREGNVQALDNLDVIHDKRQALREARLARDRGNYDDTMEMIRVLREDFATRPEPDLATTMRREQDFLDAKRNERIVSENGQVYHWEGVNLVDEDGNVISPMNQPDDIIQRTGYVYAQARRAREARENERQYRGAMQDIDDERAGTTPDWYEALLMDNPGRTGSLFYGSHGGKPADKNWWESMLNPDEAAAQGRAAPQVNAFLEKGGKNENLFELGTEIEPSIMSMKSIADIYSDRAGLPNGVQVIQRGENNFRLKVPGTAHRNPEGVDDNISITPTGPDVVHIGATEGDRSGQLLYQILNTWALRNGVEVESSYLLDANRLRLLSNTLSTAARHGQHPRDVSGTGSGTRPKAQGNASAHAIWNAEAGEAIQRLKDQGADPNRIDFKEGSFTIDGMPATEADIKSRLRELSPNVEFDSNKVGPKTLMRIAVLRHLARISPEEAGELAKNWNLGALFTGVTGAAVGTGMALGGEQTD